MLLRLSRKFFPVYLKVKKCFIVKPRLSAFPLGRKQNRYEEIEKSLKDFFNAKEEDPDHDLDLSEIRSIKGNLISEVEEENNSENESNVEISSNISRGLHHLFMVNIDPEIASLDLQTFVMKASEKLSTKGLRDFLSILNVLKTKTATNSIKNKNKKEESVFIHKCFKIFDAEQVLELKDLLIKCDVSRLTHQNFTSTISCIEEEINLHNKINKFSDFNNSQIPPERPLLNEFVKPTSDSDILDKLAKINGRGREEKKSGKISLINDLDGVDSKEDQEVQGSKNTEKLIFEMLSQEVENSLNNGFEEEKEKIEFQKEATQFNASNNWQSRNIARLTRILKETAKEKVDLRLQKPNEILTLNQHSFYSRDPPTPSTFSYIYRLPYRIEDIPSYENSLKEKLEILFGKVKSLKIFQYKDFLDVAPGEKRVITLQRSLNEIWNENDLEAAKGTKSNRMMGGETVGEIIKKLKLDEEEMQNDEIKEDPRTKYLKKSGSKTDKILTSLLEKHSSKLDKSYALVEFDSMEAKKKTLIPELRVFGFKLGNNMLAIDDADHKITLVCNNVHWGASFKNFKQALNDVIEKQNALDLKLEIDPDDEDKIITKYFILLRFNSLQDSVRALRILRKTIYEKRELKFAHLFGPLRQYKNNYCEVIDGDPNQDLLTKIGNKRILEMNKEMNKYIGVRADEDSSGFKPVINDLLFEEGVKKMVNEEEEMPPIYLHNIEEDE